MEQTIPVVDLAQFDDPNGRDAFIKAFGDAMREYGFAAVENYGIADDEFAAVYDVYRKFFALPEEKKKKYERPETGRARGYTSFGIEHAKDNAKPDLKEFFHVGREYEESDPRYQGVLPNVWIDDLPELRERSLALYVQLDEVAFKCLEALSIYLDQDPKFLPNMAKGGNTIQRFIHYPVCDGFDEPGVMRAAQHEDINLMTLLPPADESGLEILTREGEWLPVRAIPGQIIADTGDMFQRITNDKIPATTHRVVNPQGEPTPRYSMPFFIHPHGDVTLEVLGSCLDEGEKPKYPPIGADEFLEERLRAIGLKS